MTDPQWGWIMVIFAILALALFLLATWSGRWGVWLAGYLCAILALAAGIAAGYERAARAPEPRSGMPAQRDVDGARPEGPVVFESGEAT